MTLEQTLSSEEVAQIIQWYANENVSLREIEKRTGKSRSALSRMLERLGVKTTVGNHYHKYTFNTNFFEVIDTPEKAYWLGFLYADGSVQSKDTLKYGEQSFKLQLQEQDKEILEKFNLDLQSTYPIRYDNSRANPQVILEPRSQKTVDDLIRLGCVERKSLILKFPTEDQVPKQFIRDFIRGYFDGDGSISEYNGQWHITFVGTQDFITSLYEILQIGSVFPDKRKTNSWYIGINGNKQILSFYHYLYDNATRYLQRKYNKFQGLILKYGESQGIKE